MRKTIRGISIATIALVIALGITSSVLASFLWSKQLTTTVSITVSNNCQIYSDASCTTVATSVVFASFDRLNLDWQLAQPLYLKYIGSDSGPKTLSIVMSTGDSGFNYGWQISSTGTWNTNHDGQSWDLSLATINLRLQQASAHVQGGYGFAFDFNLA